jgi:hypothetical protein
LETVKKAAHTKKYFFLPPSIYGLTFACSPFVKNQAQINKATLLIKKALEILETKPTLSLELFTPTKYEQLGSFKVQAAKISEQLLEENVACIDSPYCLKLVETTRKHFMILNCTEQEYYPLSKKLFSPTKGIDLFVNINLEKIAEGNDEKQFSEKLLQTAETIKELKEKKKQLLLKRNYLKQFNVEEFKTGIGITNLYKLSENYSNKPVEFAQKTYKELSKVFEEDLLFGCTEKALKRFSESTGKEIFTQETLEFEECLKEKKCCFTGKTNTEKELGELLEKKIKQIEYIAND